MSATDLIFAFVSLLLGLGIAEVLGGFARVIAAHRNATSQVKIGQLTPLLGLFVVLDLTSFWLLTYDFRDQFRATYPMLVGVLAFCGIYYVIATLVFPADPGEWATLDDHYDRQKKAVIGGILSANLLQIPGQLVLEILVPTPAGTTQPSDAAMSFELVVGLAIFAVLVALLRTRSRAANQALLTIAVLLLLTGGTVAAAL